MSKIIIEDGLSLGQNRGVGQYTLGIAKMLSSLGLDYEMQRKPFMENIKNNTLRRIVYLVWVNTVFIFKLIFTPKINKVIFTSTIVPFIKVGKIEYISVLHDILSTIHPECRTNFQNIHANFSTFCATRLANKIITVSETAKQEIIKFYNIKPEKIHVVYNSNSSLLLNSKKNTTEILDEIGVFKKNYILSVATVYRHKNTQMLINAFEQIANEYPDIKLVLVGQKGNCLLKVNHKNIIFAGFISNDDLSVLYKNALMYVFPSIYEGFGIPIIDAQYFGVPVICSDIPVFKEVAGQGALFCEPEISEFSKSIEKLLNSQEMRKQLIEKGQNNSLRYSLANIQNQLKESLL